MSALPVVVPDASVLLKWVLPDTDEDDVGAALALRGAIIEERVGALLPTLWLFEAANTLGRRYPDDAPTLVRGLMSLGIPKRRPSGSWLEVGLDLVRRFEVTFYDASYHATALTAGGALVTADERYAKRASGAGAVMLLRDWRQ